MLAFGKEFAQHKALGHQVEVQQAAGFIVLVCVDCGLVATVDELAANPDLRQVISNAK